MASDRPPIEVEGYLTFVRREHGTARQLYLHTGAATYRLALTPETLVTGAGETEDPPVGPGHRVRVTGRAEGDALLPSLFAVRLEVLGEGRLDGR